MQWPTSAKSLKHTLKAKCSHSVLNNPALSPHLRISMDSTFEAESCDLIQSNPIHAIPPRIWPNPIQSNLIHGWIQSVSNSALNTHVVYKFRECCSGVPPPRVSHCFSPHLWHRCEIYASGRTDRPVSHVFPYEKTIPSWNLCLFPPRPVTYVSSHGKKLRSCDKLSPVKFTFAATTGVPCVSSS